MERTWMKLTAIGLITTLLAQAVLATVDRTAGPHFDKQIRKLAPVVGRQRPINRGPNPSRDPATRGGRWTPQLLRDLSSSHFTAETAPLPWPTLWYGVGTVEPFAPLQGGGEGGGHNPGESGGPGGIGGGGGNGGPQVGNGSAGGAYAFGGGSQGSWVNTNTGNRCYYETLVSWPVRGGMGIEFSIYHNSQTNYNGELGWKWSTNYYVRISYTAGSSAIVRWGDGTLVPYEEQNGQFVPPVGVYESLTHNTNGTWSILTKDQTRLDFNTSGALNLITDRNSNAITIALDSQNKVTDVTDVNGRNLHFNYAGNRISSIVDPLQRTWSFTYNIFGNMTKVTYPLLNSQSFNEQFAYDTNHCITSQTDARGKVWQTTFDNNFRLTSWKDPLLNTTTYAYNATNTVITDPMAKTITHNYSGGMLASIVDQATHSDAYQWNPDKTLQKYWDEEDHCYQFTYDSMGNMLTVTNPMFKTWTMTYSTTNDLTSTKTPLMTEPWEFHYDAHGNLEILEDPLNRSIATLGYDTYGQLTSVTNYYNTTATFEYDTYGNLWKAHAPTGVITEGHYALLGNLEWVKNANDHT